VTYTDKTITINSNHHWIRSQASHCTPQISDPVMHFIQLNTAGGGEMKQLTSRRQFTEIMWCMMRRCCWELERLWGVKREIMCIIYSVSIHVNYYLILSINFAIQNDHYFDYVLTIWQMYMKRLSLRGHVRFLSSSAAHVNTIVK